MDQQDSFSQQPYQPPSAGGQYVAPAARPRPTIQRRVAIGIGIGALFLGAGIGAAGKKDKTTTTTTTAAAAKVTTTATATVTTTQTAAAPAPVTVTAKAAAVAAPPAQTVTVTAAAPSSSAPAGIGDGTYIVGTDIKPGLYKTTGPSDTGSLSDCYWERDRDLSGGIDSIIDNGNTKGQTTVQIASGDKAFKTSGCAPWVKIG